MNRNSLLELQNQRLRNSVDLAYRKVPFYHELYQKTGITPFDVVGVKTIGKLPLVNKDQLRAVSVEERTANGTDLSRCRLHTTSGSTGKTLTVLEDETSTAFRNALNLRFLWAYGVRPRDRIVTLRITRPGAGFRLSDRRGWWAYVTAKRTRRPTYNMDLKEHIQLFSKWKPRVLMAQTSYCRTLARFSEVTGSNINFRIIVTAGEILDDPTRKFISDKFGAEVYDHYGAAEVGGSIAWECPSHSGYHIDAETLLVEFLDRGEPVKSGKPGAVHLTSFCRVATPIIRYFSGDIATPVDGECSCGRGLPLIREIQGRRMDFILTGDGRDVSPMAVIHAIQNVPGVDQFKVIQLPDFSIEILVITHDEVKSVTANIRSRCANLFRGIQFEIKLVDRIDDSSGPKFRVVESRLPHEGM
jgi:phenylacetate-coenzyme A ligase PaaK-like adenylate-forming protein